MIGFPKSSTEILNFIKKRQDKNVLSSNGSMVSILKKQMDQYLLKGLPSHRQECWRYFPVQKLIQNEYLFLEEDLKTKEETQDTFSIPNSFKIFVTNGNIQFSNPPKGLHLFLWKDFLKDSSNIDSKIKDQIYKILKEERNGFCSLNNIFALKGFVLWIDQPIQECIEIRYCQNLTETNKACNTRNFIFARKNSSAQIIETVYGSETKKDLSFFFNIQTDCILEKNSQLDYIRLDQGTQQTTQVNQLFGTLGPGAKAHFLTLNLSSGLTRYLTSIHQKEQSSSEIRGLNILGDANHGNHKVTVNHDEQSYSNQFYRSFLFDSARHIFNGKINIEQKAQKTEAYQLNKNLIFGNKALAISCPELDVKADDVKANHGATTSSMEEKSPMLFYLQSRGLGIQESYHLILLGYLKETLSAMNKKTFSYFKPLIWNHLKQLQNKNLT